MGVFHPKSSHFGYQNICQGGLLGVAVALKILGTEISAEGVCQGPKSKVSGKIPKSSVNVTVAIANFIQFDSYYDEDYV